MPDPMEGRHAFHLCACRTEEHGRHSGTERELAWLKGAEVRQQSPVMPR